MVFPNNTGFFFAQIDANIFDTTTHEDEPSLTHPLDASFQGNKVRLFRQAFSELKSILSVFVNINP